MAAVASGLSCVGGIAGFLVFDRLSASRRATPSPPTIRPARLKQIDRPAITPRAGWNARDPDHTAVNEPGFYAPGNDEGWLVYQGDLRAVYHTVVVHHSVLYDTDDLTTMHVIQDQHMDLRGWADIAYHFAVGRDGTVFEGRDLASRGTHVEHYNTGSLGVVFLGNFQVEMPGAIQIDAGRRLIDWLALRLELTHLAGHDDFNATTECPGQFLIPYLGYLADSAGLQLGTGGYQPPSDLQNAVQ